MKPSSGMHSNGYLSFLILNLFAVASYLDKYHNCIISRSVARLFRRPESRYYCS